MQRKYNLIAYDLDGTLCPSSRILPDEQLKLISTINSEQFRTIDKSGFDYKPFPGVVKTINQLTSRIRQAIISNGPGIRQRNKLILIGLEGLFDPIFISEEFARDFFKKFYENDDTDPKEIQSSIEKPNPRMLFQMNISTQTLPDKCLYVGNTLSDYIAAKKAGWDFVGITDEDEKYRDDFKKTEGLILIPQSEFSDILEVVLI